MPQIALVTYQQQPNLTRDEQALVEALKSLGVNAKATIWNDPSVAWESFDLAVIRSTWDYHLRPIDFQAWLSHVDQHTKVWNPPRLIRWNMDKVYLQDLAKAGVQIIPTKWFRQGSQPNLELELESNAWRDAVVKPSIAASAYSTWRTSIKTAHLDQSQLWAALQERDIMLQAFVPAIQTGGEWSFIFFNGGYSHAVLKKPETGDFRVQEQYGGTSNLRESAPELISQAEAITRAIPGDWLYARVDAVDVEGTLTLMELELIEPSLFLTSHPRGAQRLAWAIADRI